MGKFLLIFFCIYAELFGLFFVFRSTHSRDKARKYTQSLVCVIMAHIILLILLLLPNILASHPCFQVCLCLCVLDLDFFFCLCLLGLLSLLSNTLKRLILLGCEDFHKMPINVIGKCSK